MSDASSEHPPSAQELPRLVVTGATGFVGRRLVNQLRLQYRIEAVDRRSRAEGDGPQHPNIRWHQVDLADAPRVQALFEGFRRSGGADALVHLAAYYDFSGEDHPEYRRTNVDALRHLLDASVGLGLSRFVFASSLAACDFPPRGGALTEDSPPDGDHVYARSKRRGEQMLAEYADRIPTAVVRFAALFSDWCEYPPLYHFLETWLSQRWNARVLGGRGRSAVPYLHVRDAVLFLRRVLELRHVLDPGEVLLCSPDGAVSHEELFRVATRYHFGEARRPIHLAKPLAGLGMRGRDALGRLLGNRPFERPWMARYIDLALTADAGRTRRRLDWRPRPRLDVLRRMPFLVENLRSDPVEWQRRNQAWMEIRTLRPNLRIYGLLDAHEEAISRAFTEVLTAHRGQDHLPHYHRVSEQEHQWHHRLILRNLMHAVRTREKGVFMAYCRDLAEHRHRQGYRLEELTYALNALERICLDTLTADPATADLTPGDLHDAVTTTIHFGLDQIEEMYETLEAGRSPATVPAIRPPADEPPLAAPGGAPTPRPTP